MKNRPSSLLGKVLQTTKTGTHFEEQPIRGVIYIVLVTVILIKLNLSSNH